MNLVHAPIEINRADRQDLLRIPGVGIKGAEAILAARRQNKLHDLSTLKKMGIIAERAAPYVLLNGKRPAAQLTLF
jgi:predicted DNA-binding helix-hairpin-helix protein